MWMLPWLAVLVLYAVVHIAIAGQLFIGAGLPEDFLLVEKDD